MLYLHPKKDCGPNSCWRSSFPFACPVPCWAHSCEGICPRSWVGCCWCLAWRGDLCCCVTLCSSLAIRAAPSYVSRSWSSAGATSRSWRRRTSMHQVGCREPPWLDTVRIQEDLDTALFPAHLITYSWTLCFKVIKHNSQSLITFIPYVGFSFPLACTHSWSEENDRCATGWHSDSIGQTGGENRAGGQCLNHKYFSRGRGRPCLRSRCPAKNLEAGHTWQSPRNLTPPPTDP